MRILYERTFDERTLDERTFDKVITGPHPETCPPVTWTGKICILDRWQFIVDGCAGLHPSMSPLCEPVHLCYLTNAMETAMNSDTG